MVGFDFPRPGSAMSNASSNATEKAENMWLSMLSSVTLSRRLPQKSVLVLGGTSDGQKEFVESLGVGGYKRGNKAAPVANAFALGYTYQDVLDADHEDVLARLGIYLISEPSPAFIPLLRPLLTPHSLPETLIVVLLDWSRPWEWVRQIKTWVRLLRGIFTSLDDDCRRTLDDVAQAWESRRSTYADGGGGGGAGAGLGDVALPLGPGEFDEPIGLPLCVVCQNSDKIETLERERGWKEEEFDFVLQFLRTILLKHGAPLIYTTPSVPSSLQPLIYSMLSIQSPLRQQTLKHNVIERDKVFVPPHWDSWGKIRVLREGFDVEGINGGWSIDINSGDDAAAETEGGAVEVYEEVIKDISRGGADSLALLKGRVMEVPPVDTQEFLAQQFEVLEIKAAEDKSSRDGKDAKKKRDVDDGSDKMLAEQVGPVQFNVGGIQVDAENMMEGLKQREASRAGGTDTSSPSPAPPSVLTDSMSQGEVLSAFFNSLKKKAGGKPSGT